MYKRKIKFFNLKTIINAFKSFTKKVRMIKNENGMIYLISPADKASTVFKSLYEQQLYSFNFLPIGRNHFVYCKLRLPPEQHMSRSKRNTANPVLFNVYIYVASLH